MIKTILACIFAAFCVAACGGGGGSDSQPASKAMTISMYGKPLVSSASTATAHAQLNAVANAASAATTGASDVQATIQTLTDALAARGVPADITPEVMDGTTLHALIMGENNGLPPTADQFKTDLSGAVIANFQLDDMVTPWNDPAQQAAADQFKQDLIVFIQRMHVAGKQVHLVLPVQTCDYPANYNDIGNYTASDALTQMIVQAVGETGGQTTGGISYAYVRTFDPVTELYSTVNTVTQGHMGDDCRTPDAYLQNLQIQSIADTIAALYRESAAGASAASGASTTGT